MRDARNAKRAEEDLPRPRGYPEMRRLRPTLPGREDLQPLPALRPRQGHAG